MKQRQPNFQLNLMLEEDVIDTKRKEQGDFIPMKPFSKLQIPL
jgi:hypothetical protein